VSDWKEGANQRRDFRQGKIPSRKRKGKKRGGKKPYTVERRYVGKEERNEAFWGKFYSREWNKWGAHKTEKASRDSIKNTSKWTRAFNHIEWEYRIIFEGKVI
jgi:hypothetical protein